MKKKLLMIVLVVLLITNIVGCALQTGEEVTSDSQQLVEIKQPD